MASLSEQLAALRSLDAQRLGASTSRSQPSYLYSPRDAARYTVDDIHAVGHNGFLALMPKDEEKKRPWAMLEEPLFGEAAKRTDRTLLDKATNGVLDGHITSLLRLIGPSILLKPCGQVLEWLVRRFRIQDFNVSAVLCLFLPYHETPQFVQMLQLLQIESDPLFSALTAVKKSQLVMPRHILVTLMSKSTDMLRFVIQTLPQHTRATTTFRALVAFWLATLVSYLEMKHDLTPGELSVLLPNIFDVMRSGNSESQLAAYIVLTQLAAKVPLTSEAMQTIVTRVAQSRSSVFRDGNEPNTRATDDEAMLSTLIIVCASQEELDILPPKAMTALLQLPSLAAHLMSLSDVCDANKFMRPFVRTLARDPGTTRCVDILSEILHKSASSDVKQTACSSLLESALSEGPAIEPVSLLSILHQRSPAIYETECAKRMQSGSDNTSLLDLMARIAGTEGIDAPVLASDSSTLRLLELRRLLSDPDDSQHVTSDDFVSYLREGHLDTTKAIFEIKGLPKRLSAKDLLEVAKEVFARSSTPRSLILLYTEFLTNAFFDEYPDHAEDVIFRVLWPKLLVNKSNKKTANAIWQILQASHLFVRAFASEASRLPIHALALKSRGRNDGSLADIKATSAVLTDSIAADSTKLQSRLKALVAARAVGGPSSLLATLVLANLCYKLGKGFPIDFAVDILLSFLKLGVANTALTVKDVSKDLPDSLTDAIFAKPNSAKTAARLDLHLLAATVATLHKPDGVVPWLQPVEHSQSLSSDFRKAAGMAYQLARAIPDPLVVIHLLRDLFNTLGQDVSIFLVTGAIREDWSIELRVAALRDAASILPSSASDIMPLIVGSVPLLQHADKNIRRHTVDLIRTVWRALPEASAPALFEPLLYGDVKTLFQISQQQACHYLDNLLASDTDILLDNHRMARVHAGFGKQLRKLVLEFLFSHAIANEDLHRRLSLLETVDEIRTLPRLSLSAILLRNAAVDIQAMDSRFAERYLTILFRAYERAGKQPADDQMPFELLKEFIQGDAPVLLQKHAIAALSQYVDQFGSEQRLMILQVIVRVLPSGTSAASVDLRACGRSMTSDTELLTHFLENLNATLAPTRADGTSPAKRSRQLESKGDPDPLPKVTTFFEIVDLSAVNGRVLLGPVFTLMSLLIHQEKTDDFAIAAQSVVEAASRLIAKTSDAPSLAPLVQVNAAVNLLKVCSSPALANRIMRLLSQLTSIVSTQIIPHVMPIFTFMGSTMLQYDDDATMRVVEQTIASIIPPLVQSVRTASKDRSSLIAGMHDIVSIFTQAAPHMPQHKRVSVYSQLVSALGAHDFLAPICMLLVQQQAKKLRKGDTNRKNATDALALPLTMLAAFPPRHQLTALAYIVDEITCCPSTEANARELSIYWLESPTRTNQVDLIGRHLHALATFLLLAVTSKQLASKISSARTQGYQDIDVGIQELAKRLVTALSSGSRDSSQVLRADDEEMATVLRKCLQSLVALTAPSVFGEIILWLSDSPDLAVFLNALHLLRQHLPHIHPDKRGDVTPAIVAILRRMATLLTEAGSESEKQTPEILQTISVIAVSTTTKEHSSLSQLLDPLLDMGSIEGLHHRVAHDLLQALSGLPPVLGPRLLPKIQDLLVLAATFIEDRRTSVATAPNRKAAYGLLESTVASLPSFIVPNLPTILATLFSRPALLAANRAEEAMTMASRERLIATMIKRIPAAALSPVLIDSWQRIASLQTESILAYLGFLQRVLRRSKPDGLVECYKAIFRLFLEIFDLRRAHRLDITDAELVAIEKGAVMAFIQLVLKLSDNAFRPLFLRAVDWALLDLEDTGEDSTNASKDRPIVLFRLVDRLLSQLKEVVAPYFAFVLDPCLTYLGQQDSLELWELAASSMTHALLHGVEGYWTSTRLQHVVAPCVDQLKHASSLGTLRTSSFVGPLIVQLAATSAEHETVLKSVNTAILARMRDDFDEVIQIAAVRTLEAVWHTLGDAMAAHVPESLPIVLECLEGDRRLEAATRDLVAAMESVMGESLLDAL